MFEKLTKYIFQMGTFDTTLVVMAFAASHNLPRLAMCAECTDNTVTTMNLTTEYATNHDGEVLTVACAADYFMTDATDGSDFNGGGAGANYTMKCNNETGVYEGGPQPKPLCVKQCAFDAPPQGNVAPLPSLQRLDIKDQIIVYF